MKKYLLSLLCLLGAGLSAQAAESFTVTADNAKTLSTSGYGKFEHTGADSGITIQGWAIKSNGIALKANGGYLAVTLNTNSYKITTVKVTAKKGGSKTTTLKCLAQKSAYTYKADVEKNWTGTEIGSFTLDTTEKPETFNVNDNSFVIYNSTNGAQIIISKIEVAYETGPTPKMSFANPSVNAKVGVGVVWQEVVVTEPETRGTITYSSSNPDVVAVDAATGRILPADVKKDGSATITATRAAEGEYGEGQASYLIMVSDPNTALLTSNTVFDFSVENPYRMTTQSGNNATYEALLPNPVTSIAGDNNVASIEFGGQKYRAWKTTGPSYELRVESSSSLTFKVKEGYKITKIGMTGTDIAGTFNPKSKANADKTDETIGDLAYVWEPADETAVAEVVFTPSKTIRVKKINVMYQPINSTLKPAQLTFTPNVNGIIVGEVTEINGVNNPNNRPNVEYTIAGLNNTEYSIVKKDDGKIAVTVNTPGSYTLEARTAEGDGFRDGFAIMRLNVYRHLDVFVDNSSDAITEDKIKTDTEKTVTIDVPANAHLYYKITPAPVSPEAYAAGDAAEPDENLEDGFTEYDYDNGITIPAKTNGTLEYYIANYGYKSPKRRIALSFTTGVEEIEGVQEAPVRYFDLNGREVKGDKLERGVYVRMQGGKATKVLVK